MKYSRKDLILTGLAALQLGTLFLWALTFSQISWMENTVFFIWHTLLFYFNPIVITHNFLHTPFFHSNLLNKAFTIINSMNLGLPQILYRHHHLAHHRLNNKPNDPSSTKRYGKNGDHEHWVSYCALSLFRDGTQKAWEQVVKKGEQQILGMQLASVAIFIFSLIFLNYRFFLIAYLPLFFLGWFLAHMENYFEHYRAKDESNRFANSVSFDGDIYNTLMFNEGLHQEHHIAPQAHWTKRAEIRDKFAQKMRENGTYRASYPPLLGFLDG